VPFTLRNLKEDLEDLGSRFDGAPDLEFRSATDALDLEKSGLSYQRVPPGYRFPYGHTHKKQEEVYVVLRGSGRMKVDDEIVELKEWDAVRVPPGTWQGYEAGPDGLEILVIGAPTKATLLEWAVAVAQTLGVFDLCASVTRCRFRTESFCSRRVRGAPLKRSHEVGQNGRCQFRTTALVCATATATSRSLRSSRTTTHVTQTSGTDSRVR
jgi:hypothetical protein